MAEKEQLARQVIDLAKAQILSDNHFLSSAVGRLRIVPVEGCADPFATDGTHLAFDADRVLRAFVAADNTAPKHDVLHAVLHCIFLHPYVGATIDRDLWDLACDMAVERVVAEICGMRPGARGSKIASALNVVENNFKCRATAEKIYASLKSGMWGYHAPQWCELFHSDDHAAWYVDEPPADTDDGRGSDQACSGSGRSASAAAPKPEQQDEREDERSDESQREETEQVEVREFDSSQASENEANGSGASQNLTEEQMRTQGQSGGANSDVLDLEGLGAILHQLSEGEVTAQQNEWRTVATALAVNLQTYAKARGSRLEGFVDDLERAAGERVDYRDFLRQFAVSSEVMRLSDDEFDYVFYTYGLKLYGNVPLVEPLEYREEKRIREFVIVIDTSGSVQGDIVRTFVNTTFDILKATESFHEKVHVRILQCDAEVQTDDTIHSLDELRAWGNSFKIHGFGGTDFRPAFHYVDDLVEQGEFENLGGLIYFTDGFGIYPEWMPEYKTAFCFYDDNYRPENVPPWAVQAVLGSRDIDE